MKNTLLTLTALVLLPLAAPAHSQNGAWEADDQASYGYVRTLEGAAVLTRADTGERVDLLPNYPLETGDVLATDPHTRAELVLPDFTLVRLDGDTALVLARLAYSAEGDATTTVLELERGELQLEVTPYALGDQLPTIHTSNATIYLLEPGLYRLGTSPLGETRLVVREGYAEVGTARGSAIARSEEEIVVAGGEWPTVSVLEASYPDDLERWADQLAAGAQSAEYVDEVDPALGYSAAPLAEHGEWVSIEGETAWRPSVEVSWRPFSRGNWVHSRAGLTWLSYEPWGWVTSHYGYWSLHSNWGWIWYPGYVYSPAWVYWYWGPEWAGWVPAGYYGSPYYSPFYGYAGGSWGYFGHWTFCPTAYVVHPHGHRHYYPGREMERRTGRPAVPRGVITTHTGGIERAVWRDGAQVAEVLERRARDRDGTTPPDVTDFIAGRGERPRDAVRLGARDGVRSDGIRPDRPGTIADRGPRAEGRQDGRPGVDDGRRTASDRFEAQGWRQGTSDRTIVIRPRGDAARSEARDLDPRGVDTPGGDSHRDAWDADSDSRLRQAWRSRYESSERYRIWQGHGGDSRGRGDAESSTRGSSSDWRRESLPPARRVIDGIRTGADDSGRGRHGASSGDDRRRSERATPPPRSSRDRSSTSRRSGSGDRGRSASPRARGRSSDHGARSGGRSAGSRRSDGGRSSGSRSDGGSTRGRGGSRGDSGHGG